MAGTKGKGKGKGKGRKPSGSKNKGKGRASESVQTRISYTGPLRAGGVRPEDLPPIANASAVLKPQSSMKRKNMLQEPIEILYQVCSYLPAPDLISCAQVSQLWSDVALNTLYSRVILRVGSLKKPWETEDQQQKVTWVHGTPQKLPKGRHASYLRRLRNIPLKEDYLFPFLKALPELQDLGIDCTTYGMLALTRDKHYSVNWAERMQKLVSTFPDIIKQLTTLSIRLQDVKLLNEILPHTTNLEVLHIDTCVGYDPFMMGSAQEDPDAREGQKEKHTQEWRDLVSILENTVSKQLHKIRIQDSPATDEIDKILFGSLSSAETWPRLDAFWTIKKPALPFSTINPRWPRFLENAMKAAHAHGRWRFPIDDPALDVYEAGLVPPGQLAPLHQWLLRNATDYEGEWKVDEATQLTVDDPHPYIHSGFVNPALALSKPAELASAGLDLKLRVESTLAPSPQRLRELLHELAPRLSALSLQPLQLPLSAAPPELTTEERYEQLTAARGAWDEWNSWLEEFLPRCTSLHTLQLAAHTMGNGGGDLPLARFRSQLASLVRDHALRHLDVDCSGLFQPQTALDGFNEFDAPRARHVVEMLQWISMPFTPPEGEEVGTEEEGAAEDTVLVGLHTLMLRGMSILRPAEADWLLALPAALPALRALHIHGLVWDLNHDPNAPDNWEDDAPFLGAVEGKPGDVEEPEDEADKMMNQMLAQFFLGPDFEQMLAAKMGIPRGVDPMSVPAYAMQVMSRDAMRGELETRAATGVRTIQGNPWRKDPVRAAAEQQGRGQYAPAGAAGPAKGKAKGKAKEEEELRPAEFGADPRFGVEVDEALRTARLAEWLTGKLRAAAGETEEREGALEVRITDLRTVADGMVPWTFRQEIEDEKERRRREADFD